MTKTNINSGSDHVKDCISEKVKAIIYAEREIEKARAREDEDMRDMDRGVARMVTIFDYLEA